jgi:hypothetical protein
MSSGTIYRSLTVKAAAGDRDAAKRLVTGGWWPENWNADSVAVQDQVIAGSRIALEQFGAHERMSNRLLEEKS